MEAKGSEMESQMESKEAKEAKEAKIESQDRIQVIPEEMPGT